MQLERDSGQQLSLSLWVLLFYMLYKATARSFSSATGGQTRPCQGRSNEECYFLRADTGSPALPSDGRGIS